MRLYAKLFLMAALTCLVQTAIGSSAARETYFAVRCYVATLTRDAELERRLVSESQVELAAKCREPLIIVASSGGVSE